MWGAGGHLKMKLPVYNLLKCYSSRSYDLSAANKGRFARQLCMRGVWGTTGDPQPGVGPAVPRSWGARQDDLERGAVLLSPFARPPHAGPAWQFEIDYFVCVYVKPAPSAG